MSSLLALRRYSDENIIAYHFEKRRLAAITQVDEIDAAITIQSWFRAERVRAYIKFLHRSAVVIQRNYRGHVDRGVYRAKVQKKLKALKEAYFACLATKIQCRWRGYYVRKYIFNYSARKTYLKALQITNARVLEQLNAAKISAEQERKQKETEKAEAALLYSNRKQHYLLSTEVSPGVYNSPSHKGRYIEKEIALKEVLPLSQEERDTLKQADMMAFLQTSTGIPTAAQEILLRGKSSPPLPPITTQKPQGPFRSPSEVQQQRYKKLQPSLRVATDFESVDSSRTKLRAQDWTKQIIDEKFLPTTKSNLPYKQLLHTKSAYGSLPYGTEHFRNRNTTKEIHRQPFRRHVEAIPLFDQLGKTY